MRITLLVLMGIAFAGAARGQDQEQKLIDRLLKPNTALGNSAQNKKFVADGASINKKATVSTFYVQGKEHPKAFAGPQEYQAKKFDSRAFYAGRDHATVSTQTAVTGQRSYSTWIANASGHSSSDRNKKSATRDYEGKRPFLDRGKSPNSLKRNNTPMTIEQVRELLNKNK